MINLICQGTTNPDIGFAVSVNEKDKERAKELIKTAWNAWWYASHPEDWIDNEYFSKEDVASFYESGYSEPTEQILTQAGIDYEIHSCFDADGELFPEFNQDYEFII